MASLKIKDENGNVTTIPVVKTLVVKEYTNAKEEQEKSVEITENGTTEIIPDEGKVLSKVTVNVDVESEENYAKYARAIEFSNLNLFGKPDVYLDLTNAVNLGTAFVSNVESNITVKHLTVKTSTKPTNVNAMFYAHSKCIDDCLRHITLYIDTSEAPNMASMFLNLRALEIVDGEPLNFAKATTISGSFGNCKNLKEIRFLENNISVSISFKDSNLLSDDSIQSIINGLATVETSQTLTLHADVKAKLTEAQLTQITSKNWTLA